MDENVHGAISKQLTLRGIDVLRIQDDGRQAADDPEILDRATELGRVVFTRDEDFLAEAATRQRQGVQFAGVIFAQQMRLTLGECVTALELLAAVLNPEEVENGVIYLPV